MNFLTSNYRTLFVVFLIVSFLVIAFFAGFFVNNLLNRSKKIQTDQTLSNPVFTSQQATIDGKITSIQGRTLNISGDNGGNIAVEAGEGISITKNIDGVPSISSDIKEIELNKSSVISLVMNQGRYIVTSVYILSAPQNVSSEPLMATTSAIQTDSNTATSPAGPPLRANP